MPFYPRWLYEPADSPLHFLQRIRSDYIATYNDPIVQWTPESGRDSWIPLFTHIEMLFQLPTAMVAVRRLGGRRTGTTGSDELLFLVYALETALTTLVCLHDVFWWDNDVYPAELKNAFLFKIYGPWFAIREYLLSHLALMRVCLFLTSLHFSYTHVCRHVLQVIETREPKRGC